MSDSEPNREDDRIAIFGDFHLGTQCRPGLFARDREFQRLVDRLCADASADGVALRLILLGDTFDFPSVSTRQTLKRDSDGDLVNRCQRILDEHPDFRKALRSAINFGASIDLLPGNHDPALMRPAVRQLLHRELIGSGSGTLNFHPWILHIKSVLFAEHGNQYHDINSFPEWLAAEDVPLNQWGKPIGARLDELKRSDEADSSEQLPDSSGQKGSQAWLSSARTRQVRFAVRAAMEAVSLHLPTTSRRREQYRQKFLGAAADSMSLPIAVPVAIDNRAEVIAHLWPTRIGGRLARRILGRSAGPGAIAMTDDEKRSHFRDVAAEIGVLLAGAKVSVAYCAFGHTHLPDFQKGPNATFVNAGTWLDPEPGSAPESGMFPFVQINVDRTRESIVGTLLVWDDANSEIRPHPKMETA